MSELKNPMRFSIRNRNIDVSNFLDHADEVDDVQRRVTNIDVKPSQGNVYVHWEEV